jgi:hypothetical protein
MIFTTSKFDTYPYLIKPDTPLQQDVSCLSRAGEMRYGAGPRPALRAALAQKRPRSSAPEMPRVGSI